jgi:signal transduction histidine kinase
VPWLRRRALVFLGGAQLFTMGYAAYAIAGMGDPGQPWFHFFHFVPLLAVTVSLPIATRAWVTVSFAVALCAGYFGMHPQYLHHPLAGATVSYLAFTTIFSFATGLAADVLRRRAFFLYLSVERRKGELAALSASLEQRVREQTQELRQLAGHLESAREEERARVARDLHDELGQEMTGLGYAVELARLRIERGGSVANNLKEIGSLVQRLRATTRTILTELRPRVLDDLGLGAAAEWLAARVRERSGLDVRLALEPENPELPPAMAGAVFRILQEALSNVARHAHARTAEVTVRCGDSVEIVVRDDGAGFDPSRRSGGFGLIGMRERARSFGGQVAVRSAAGGGTEVRVELPLVEQAAERVA